MFSKFHFLTVNPRSSSGVTLIELLVVVAIIGILGMVVVTAVNPTQRINESRDTQIRADLAQMRNALESYAAANNGKYPSTGNVWWCENCTSPGTTAQGKNNWIPQLVSKGYLKQLPTSPRNLTGYYGAASAYYYSTDAGGDHYKITAWGTPTTGFNSGDYAPSTPYCVSGVLNTNPDGVAAHRLRPMVDPADSLHSFAVYSSGGACW